MLSNEGAPNESSSASAGTSVAYMRGSTGSSGDIESNFSIYVKINKLS